jgi:hypothetical protein
MTLVAARDARRAEETLGAPLLLIILLFLLGIGH